MFESFLSNDTLSLFGVQGECIKGISTFYLLGCIFWNRKACCNYSAFFFVVFYSEGASQLFTKDLADIESKAKVAAGMGIASVKRFAGVLQSLWSETRSVIPDRDDKNTVFMLTANP